MVVPPIIGGERAHDRHAVGSLRHLGEGSAEPDTRQVGLDLTGATANVSWNIKFGVKGLDLGRPALQEEEDDRFLFVEIPPGCGLGEVCKKAR